MSTTLKIRGARLTWKLREQMTRAGIATVIELHGRLKAFDPAAVKYAQFARIIDRMPERLSARTLLGLVVVLDCKVEDLLTARKGGQ